MNSLKSFFSWLSRFLEKARTVMLNLVTAFVLVFFIIMIIGALTSGPEVKDPSGRVLLIDPEGSVVESHDAGMYKNEDAYCMISKKMQKEAYEEFTQSIALAEAIAEMKAEQAKKKQSKPRKKRIKKSAMVRKSRQRPQIKLMLGFASFFSILK